ncbi:MAG: hypothetical protein IKX00_02735 [Bacilli bacterium]|nr:hypothetical protein [Bacilli bacterium]
MKELIENLANNNYVIIGLSVLLLILVIIFLVLLFAKNKNKKPVEPKAIDEENIAGTTNENNLDFDHSEYVKETTAEFELTPITDVQPTPDGFVPNVSAEESPAIDVKTKTVDEVPLANFSFDELSKSISQEIENLKKEEENNASISSTDDSADTFKQIDDIKPVEVTKVDNINAAVNTDAGVTNPTLAPEVASFNEFIIEAPVAEATPNPAPAPSFEPVQSAASASSPAQQTNPQPVISDVQTPLFASFNQETYDINKKD